MGRKPLPTNLKLLRGNPGKRVLQPDSEPKPTLVDGEIKPPSWLKGAARQEWAAQLLYLTTNRVIGENELSMLAAYCHLMGQFVVEAKAGRTLQAALIGKMLSLAGELGIGPSARSKIKVRSGSEAQETEEKRFFG
ncbi:MAG TPA: hypothetical protein VIK52_04955 [Opitutaceae bacterium]